MSASGESTTPLPITHLTLLRRIPDGIKWRTVFTVDYKSVDQHCDRLGSEPHTLHLQSKVNILFYLRHPIGAQNDYVICHLSKSD